MHDLSGSTAVHPERGDWIRTYTGGRFYLTTPAPEDVRIEDIAHALSQICRFTGHTRRFYSVAEHCVHVSKLVEPRHALWGLLHDAAEAYIGDVARPLKHAYGMDGYRRIEILVEAAVLDAFHIPLTPMMEWDVKQADLHMLCVEARDLLGITDFEAACWRYWTEPNPKLRAVGWGPQAAKDEFLARFKELTS
ncbi:MAG TPA: hypothetical protein VF167_00025 [Longimicrobiaceae bacterium]